MHRVSGGLWEAPSPPYTRIRALISPGLRKPVPPHNLNLGYALRVWVSFHVAPKQCSLGIAWVTARVQKCQVLSSMTVWLLGLSGTFDF